ncbi:MAG: MBL fold metallo-hydrolase [Streptosporangiaceae bacterium]
MSSAAADITVPGPPEVAEVSAGVFAYVQPDGTWWINNTGFLIGPQGVIGIDSCSTERRTRALQRAIAALTPMPVRAVVNTHHHGDHTFGNCLFPGAAIIGHDQTRAEAIAFGPPRELPAWDGPDWGALSLDPPFITFADGLTVHAGDVRAEVRHVGSPAHTTNDSIVWIPEHSVLFCGDLIFNGGTPFLLMGSVEGAIEVLETVIRPLGAATIVPGHGNVFHDTRPIEDTLDYLRFVLAVARRSRDAGLAPLQAARSADLGRFAGWADGERIVGNLHRAYAELAGAPRGAPIDTVAALTDMVAYNGGAPLTCRA